MISAVVLAGGRGRRFQSGGDWVDKLAAELGGRPVISRVLSAVSEVASEVVVAVDSPERGRRYLEFVPAGVDSRLALDPPSPYRSPALGVFSGVSSARGDVILVVPGDAAFVRPAALEGLARAVSPGGSEASAPMWSGGIVETLFMALDGDWAREAAALLADGGWRRPDGLIRGAPRASLLPAEDLSGGDCRTFMTVNTREDLESGLLRPGPGGREIRLSGGDVRPSDVPSTGLADLLRAAPFWAGVLALAGRSPDAAVGVEAFRLEASKLSAVGVDFLAAHALKDAARAARMAGMPGAAEDLRSEAEAILNSLDRGSCEVGLRRFSSEMRIS